MILYLDATTKVPDLTIDYIEVKLKNGQEVSLNWDESDISRSKTGFSARYKGVYFDEDYANGRLAELEGMQIAEVGLYSDILDLPLEITIDGMEFLDFDQTLTFDHPTIGPPEKERPTAEVKKIKVYDLDTLFAENNLVPFHYNKVAVFEGARGVILAEHEAVHQREQKTSDTVVIPATRPNEPGRIWIMPQYDVTLPIDEIMTAPCREMTIEEFFDRRTYNPRCESNYALLMRNLREIGFDLHGYFPVQRPTLDSQIDSAAFRQTSEKSNDSTPTRPTEPNR